MSDFLKLIESIDKEGLIQYISKTFFNLDDLVKHDELYYYTDVSTLLTGILRTDEICLWASRWSYLNDTQEILNGIEEIKSWNVPDYLPNGLLQLNDLGHVVSLSMAKDSLPMWNMYGNGGKGVMIVFDTMELLKQFDDRIQPCLYSNSEYEIAVKEKLMNPIEDAFWLSLTDDQKRYVLIILSMYFVNFRKDHHYDYEKEVRIFGIGNPYYDTEKEIKYRYGKDKIIPYVEEKIPKSALKGICFGPIAEYDLSKKALIEFLEKHNYKDVTITKSEILYRG